MSIPFRVRDKVVLRITRHNEFPNPISFIDVIGTIKEIQDFHCLVKWHYKTKSYNNPRYEDYKNLMIVSNKEIFLFRLHKIKMFIKGNGENDG